ncbi:MAG: HAD family hydrolase [Actinomycetota bacterium]
MELEAAIFDFGGVLTTSVADAFGRFDTALGVEPGTIINLMRQRHIDESPFHQLEKGLISEAQYYDELRARLEQHFGRTLEWPDDPRVIRKNLVGSLKRNEEMLAAIEMMAEHYKIGMLTNNVREWSEWRSKYPMHLFETVVDSCEVGMRKPDPEIYKLTCERLGVSPERAVFVDDLEINVEGARSIGMRGIHFTSTDEVLAELEGLFPRAFQAAS